MEGDICDYYSCHKLRAIKRYVNNMIDEFKDQLKECPDNIIAAFAIDTYKEIKRELNK